MPNLASRVVKTISDATIGTVIVLVHVALAERELLKSERRKRERPRGHTRPPTLPS